MQKGHGLRQHALLMTLVHCRNISTRCSVGNFTAALTEVLTSLHVNFMSSQTSYDFFTFSKLFTSGEITFFMT